MSDQVQRASASETLLSTNPAKAGAVLGSVMVSTEAEIQAKVLAARKAQVEWRHVELAERIRVMEGLKDIFTRHRDDLIRLTSQEMGMPLDLSKQVVDGPLSDMAWHLRHAPKYLEPQVTFEDNHEVNELRHEPYGVIACVMAWNFPFWNFVQALSQGLLAGNGFVVKYSEEIPLFSHSLEQLIDSSDLPKGLVGFVYGDGRVGELLIDQSVDMVSFTGSTATGRKIYQKAASKLIPVSLELGGSSPGVVFEDCRVGGELIETLFWNRFANSAQFCDGMKRLIVHNSLLDEVADKLSLYAQSKILGDPLLEGVELGPLVAERQVVSLERQVKDALQRGAKLLCGGKRPRDLEGAFYEPTILTDVNRDMLVWREEVFGPVLPIIGFDRYEEAITLANDTDYGLSAFVFSQDQALVQRAMAEIQAGSVNHATSHTLRPQNPFGGYKMSGIGRQCGPAGFHEATQMKIVSWLKG